MALPIALCSGLAWIDYRVEADRAREVVTITTDALAEHARTVMETINLVLARADSDEGDR